MIDMIDRYFDTVHDLLKKVLEAEKPELDKAALAVADTIMAGGMVYVYGSGHAHMSAEELFYRAGGLANVYPIFIEPLMLHESASTSSILEKKEGYLTDIINKLPISSKDVVIVTSTSGRNATPIETALIGKEKGATVITVFSKEYSLSSPSGHSSGKRLMDAGDIKIDNKAPIGDAALSLEGLDVKFAPVSTVINLTILQSIMAQAIKNCMDKGFTDIPVFKSGNLPGGLEYNKSLIEKYGRLVPPLRYND